MGLDNVYHPLHIGVDVQLLGAVVDIHQQQVVQQQVLDEVVLVKTLLVGHQQVLYLERGQLAHHVDIVAGALGQHDVL